ncbi:MAG: helix-turn-helix domain-containing protein [Verrucomicrobia bacterium]|nr:helix-turn-helix domain-containing protein [Verrucomicrobiota bacterium]
MRSDVHEVLADDGGEWLSIQEACAFLGISQPTIFRWMKQGLVSFYKVGGSTRFSKAGLQAVIEKTTGAKEAAAAAGRCASCGHHELAGGQIQGIGRMYFRPARTKFWSLEEALVPIQAHVCTACGHVQLHADAEKLRRLTPSRAMHPDGNAATVRAGKGGAGRG